ncbi:MAG: hypothetical protein KGD63_05155 [Candidatus Lokiarchaeota archaeon]|nr:hypothetical protein [Candidatus Lokiarchaeota archaeon]
MSLFKKILPFVLIFLTLSSSSLQGIASAQTPSYVGVQEGDEYIWGAKMNRDGLESLEGSLETYKDNFKESLGEYGNLNASEAMKEIIIDSINNISILPSGWENKNITMLFEDTIVYYVELMNETIQNIPSDWLLLNITTFFDYVIEGYDVGDDDIFDLIEFAANNITSDYGDSLPLNWETYNLIDFIIWEYDNFLNDTFFMGLIPEGWEDLEYFEYLAVMVPGLDANLVDFISYLADIPFMNGTMRDLLIEAYGSLLFEDAEDILTFTMKDMMNMTLNTINGTLGIIPDDWDTISVSDLAHEILVNINNTVEINSSEVGLTFLSANMSTFIELTKELINQTFYFEESYSYTMMENLEALIEIQIMGINQSLYSIIPDWDSLTINQLIDQLYSTFEVMYTQQLDNLALSGVFYGIKIKVVIEDIFSEVPQSNMTYTPINYTLWIEIVNGQYEQLPPQIMEMLPFPPIMNIIDATSIGDPTICLAEQAKSSMLLFIGTNYDTSLITWSNMIFELPEPFQNIETNIIWNDIGVLSSAIISYGFDQIASFILSPLGEIPGYEISIILSIGIIAILGLGYFTNKRRQR